MSKVYVIGTCDTKEAELRFAADCVRRAGAAPVLVDVGTKGASLAADVSAAEIAAHHPQGAAAVLGLWWKAQLRLVPSHLQMPLSRYPQRPSPSRHRPWTQTPWPSPTRHRRSTHRK